MNSPTATISAQTLPNHTDSLILGTSEQAPIQSIRLLVVDDERGMRTACETIARSLGFTATSAASGDEALREMEQCPADIVLMDLRMPRMGGLECLDTLRKKYPSATVVIMSGFGSIDSAVEAMKRGAYDFIKKPFHLEELKLLLRRIEDHISTTAENRLLRQKLEQSGGFSLMVGSSPEMQQLYRIVSRTASSPHPMLISGETGVGKELLARSIHQSGPMGDRPFVAVDSVSLSPKLMESELFGSVRDSFEGAVDKEGLLSLEGGCTVFFDEIADLPLELQVRLFRALQDRQVKPIGATQSVPLTARVLASTKQDLARLVTEGKFRQDLYFRLNVLSARVPALRERQQDIAPLAGYFLQRDARNGSPKKVSDNALRILFEYDWPGNVRQLENCLEHACTLTHTNVIVPADLPEDIRQRQKPRESEPQPLMTLAEIEKRAILDTIDRVHGDKLKAAKALGIGRTTLYRKLLDYGIKG